jgi:membrane-associated phospholipid phosphatase
LEVGSWQEVTLGYVSYLAVVSFTRREFVRTRRPLLVAAAVAWTAYAAFGRAPLSPVLRIVIPSFVLLGGYRLSGLLFVRPNEHLERWLLSVDDRLLWGSGVLPWFHRAPSVVNEYFELSYLLVYLAVPAGATTLVVSGHSDQVDRFWTIVLLAEFACYAMLPWIQTRPPRAIETSDSVAHAGVVRRLNLSLVNRASIQVNTLPSGHAAGAVATALAVGSSLPLAGIAFLFVALSISIATVIGRYHYVVDTALGVLVAIVAWQLT